MIRKPFETLVASLAARTPTPGGGAAAALTACMGAALFLMVVRFTRGKKAATSFEKRLETAENLLHDHIERLKPMAERDARGFNQVAKAYGLPKDTAEEQRIRTRAIQEGMLGAMVVPEETICMVRDVFKAMATVSEVVGKNIVADLGTGAELLCAAAEGSFNNVRINAAYLEDKEKGAHALSRCESVMADIKDEAQKVRAVVQDLLG